MYRAAIADDEIGIREGLMELVDWKNLGFSLVGAYEDGDGLLPLLMNDPPDLVITDIRMNHCSGLDISRYIQANGLHTKVILISGYKEADLAMSAIKYGVKDYILKPVDLDELNSCITKIRTELEQAADALHQKEKLEQAQTRVQDMLQLLYEEILSGRLLNSFEHKYENNFEHKKLLERTLGLLYPDLSLTLSPCFSLSLNIRQYNHFTRNAWKQNYHSLAQYIQTFSNEPECLLEMRIVSEGPKRLVVFGILSATPNHSARETVNQNISLLRDQIKANFGISTEVGSLSIFSSISSMIETFYHTPEASASQPDSKAAQQEPEQRSCFSEQVNIASRTEDYILLHIEENISLDDIAEHFYLSPSYFSRIFKAQTGENFVHFVSRYKIEYAAKLLSDTDLKIYDICERIGYKSLKHFNRLFKKCMGMQPSVYRRRIRMGDFNHEA